MRWTVFFGLALLIAPVSWAQDEAPMAPQTQEEPRLGRFRMGRFFLTPYFTIGTIGVDANVFFTQTGRERDITASGGPGLRAVLPVGRLVRVTGDGSLNYLWFAEQADQRRLMGSGMGRVDLEGLKAAAGFEARYDRSFERIDFEVDQRLDQRTKTLRVDGRLGERDGGVVLTPYVIRRRYEVEDPPVRGVVSVSDALSRDEWLAVLPVSFKLTVKTRFLLEGQYSNYGFLYDMSRNGDTYRFGAGFELVSSTRLSGRVIAGPSLFRPAESRLPEFTTPWVSANVRYAIGLKSSVEARFDRTIGYSATSTTVKDAPLRTNQEAIFGWTQRLVGRLGTRIWGGLSTFETRGEVFVPGANGPELKRRRDEVWQGGGDLLVEVAPKLTVGVGAYYTERQSNVEAFGVEGLSFGVVFNYAGPVRIAFRP